MNPFEALDNPKLARPRTLREKTLEELYKEREKVLLDLGRIECLINHIHWLLEPEEMLNHRLPMDTYNQKGGELRK